MLIEIKEVCYGLSILCPLAFTCWNPMYIMMVLGDRVCRRCLSHKNRASMKSSDLLICEDIMKICNSQEGSCQTWWHCVLRITASRNVKNKFPLFISYLVYGICYSRWRQSTKQMQRYPVFMDSKKILLCR